MAGLTAVQRRQRAAPPYNRDLPRKASTAPGGQPARGLLVTANAQIQSEVERFPGNSFDTLVRHDRTPWLDSDNYIPPPVTWISWTAAGPVRSALHMRQATVSQYRGNSASRYPVANTPTGGLHTTPTSGPSGTPQTQGRYLDTPQMRAVRVDRLTIGQYNGQSYSGTTAMQGRAGRRTV